MGDTRTFCAVRRAWNAERQSFVQEDRRRCWLRCLARKMRIRQGRLLGWDILRAWVRALIADCMEMDCMEMDCSEMDGMRRALRISALERVFCQLAFG